jgi:hypothetical protein
MFSCQNTNSALTWSEWIISSKLSQADLVSMIKAVNIVLYLEDGLGMSLDYDSCFKDSFFIRKSLTEAVFFY